MGTRVGVDAVAKRKNPCICRESNPGSPVRSRVTVLTELHRPLTMPYEYPKSDETEALWRFLDK